MRPLEYIKQRIKSGHYTFNREEAAQAIKQNNASLNSTLNRLKHDGWIYPLSRGFYLALDVQHQARGFLDPIWFVDDWARHHKVEYYVAGLSAAEQHGAAHQRPMEFQVFTDRQIRSIRHPELRIQVLYKKEITDAMWERRKTVTGYFHLATPEMTAYDIVGYRRSCPSLDQAATVLVELGEAISEEKLAALVDQGGMLPVFQRIGWLLDRAGWGEKTGLLHLALQKKKLLWRPLDSRLADEGEQDRRWKIVVNTEIQPDIER